MTKTLTILSTDIGSDVDDTWALAQLLRSPELELKMILTETGEAKYRGAVAAKLLENADRSDVDIALGLDFGVMGDQHRHQGPWVAGYQLDEYPGHVHRDGVAAFIELVRQADSPVNVIAIGPAPSLAEAVRQAPDIAKKCRLFGMFGSFDIGYDGQPTPANETNVREAPDALRTLLSVDWDRAEITPLDTCGLVDLRGDHYHAIWSATQDPLLRGLIENYCIWAGRVPWTKCDYFVTRSSILFDCVAVYMAYSGDLLEFDEFRFDITDDGYTRRNPDGPYQARVAMRWKELEAFQFHLAQRLLGNE